MLFDHITDMQRTNSVAALQVYLWWLRRAPRISFNIHDLMRETGPFCRGKIEEDTWARQSKGRVNTGKPDRLIAWFHS